MFTGIISNVFLNWSHGQQIQGLVTEFPISDNTSSSNLCRYRAFAPLLNWYIFFEAIDNYKISAGKLVSNG